MNRKQKKELRQRLSTRQLMGIDQLTEHGLKTAKGELVFFRLRASWHQTMCCSSRLISSASASRSASSGDTLPSENFSMCRAWQVRNHSPGAWIWGWMLIRPRYGTLTT